MKKLLLLLLVTAVIFSVPLIALASDIDDAEYKTTITVSNNGTVATNAAVPFTLSTEEMINVGMLADNASDAVMIFSGDDVAFMPASDNSSPWMTWVSSIGSNSQITQYLYTKNASGGKLCYFPDTAGMSANDSATLELADNFTIEQSGFVGATGSLICKEGAFSTNTTATGSTINITSIIENDAGANAENRAAAATSNVTFIILDNPCATTGNITSVEIFANVNLEGMVVGSFYNTGGTDFTCRDSYAIGSVTAGAKQTKTVNFYIESGDYIGCYYTAGQMETDQTGFDGYYYLAGEHIDPEDSGTYSLLAGDTMSLYGRGGIWVTASNLAFDEYTVRTQYTPNLLTNSSFETGDPPDDWTLSGAGATVSQNAVNKQFGSYSANVTRNGTNAVLYQSIADYENYKGETIAAGVYIKTDTASVARFQITDGVVSTISTYHDGDNAWQYFDVRHTVDASATKLQMWFQVSNNNASAYFDGAILIVGDNVTSYDTLRLYIDDVEQDAVYTEESVPDNSNPIVYYKNMGGYWDYTKIWQGDNLTQHIEWEYDPVEFTDLSGNGNDTDPTFRTTTSNANVSAEVTQQEGLITGSTPSTNITGGWTMIGAVPETPENLFDEGGDAYAIGDFNIGELVTDWADSAGQPAEPYHFVLAFGIALIVIIGVFAATHKARMGRQGSLTLAFLAGGLVLVIFYRFTTIPGWILIPYGLGAILLIMWKQSYSPVD